MRASEIHDYARRLLEAQGYAAIAEAVRKARMFEERGDDGQAQTWRRIEAAMMEIRGPSVS